MFKLTISPEEIEKLEPAGFQGQIHVISRPGLEFSRAIAYLKKQKVIGFDTETKPVFSPGQHHNGVALLQLSGPDQASFSGSRNSISAGASAPFFQTPKS